MLWIERCSLRARERGEGEERVRMRREDFRARERVGRSHRLIPPWSLDWTRRLWDTFALLGQRKVDMIFLNWRKN